MTAQKAKKPSKKAVKAADLQVVYRKPADLKPDPRNARQHSAQQIAELRASIRQFGFTNPVLLRPNGMIGAGHGRWEAAKLEKLETIPTITLHMDEDRWRAYAIADNKIPLGATWDKEILGEELLAVTASGLDLVGLGFESFAAELAPAESEDLTEGGAAKGSRVNQSIIQFNIVFENEEQQAVWFDFVRRSKTKYPDDSLGARLALILPKVKV